ncbi:MAG: MltA domain-containing protein [Desulfobacter sp.]|nr:MAG: MltA domain-containing protein [Desulfobacter sp.]
MAALAIAAVILICGCGDKRPAEDPSRLPMERLSKGDVPEFRDTLGFKDLEASILQSLVYFTRVPATRVFVYGKDRYDAAHMIRSLETFQAFMGNRPSPAELSRFIRDRYHVYKSVGNTDGEVLFTGYFEPTYRGSLTRGGAFAYPVYSVPNDLFQIDLSKFSEKYKGHKRLMARVDADAGRILPYYARKEINNMQGFHDRAEPLVWLASRVDRFFLEIQGSGRVALDTGEIMRIHYAGTNGNAYRSVGKYLIDKGEVPREKMSMQAIRQWLEANPDRMDEVLHYNESFVFFKNGRGGPYGNIGVTVTPLRSIATDVKVFPRGGLAFVDAALPEYTGQPKEGWEKASFFVLNQDTGGAIKGPGRVDIFCGNGEWAAYTAGHMTAPGQLYFLVLKP